MVLGIAFRRWIDGAGPSDSVDIVESELLCQDVARVEVVILTILRIG